MELRQHIKRWYRIRRLIDAGEVDLLPPLFDGLGINWDAICTVYQCCPEVKRIWHDRFSTDQISQIQKRIWEHKVRANRRRWFKKQVEVNCADCA